MTRRPGLRFVLLWTAASFIGAAFFLFIQNWVRTLPAERSFSEITLGVLAVTALALLTSVLHWFVLGKRWGRPNLLIWLVCTVLLGFAAMTAVTVALTGGDAITVLFAESEADAGATLERYSAVMGRWTTDVVLLAAGFFGYAVGMAFMSWRAAIWFSGATVMGAFAATYLQQACAELPVGLSQDAAWWASETVVDLFGGIGAMLGIRLQLTQQGVL